jgi:hypothetical protein
MFFLMTPSHRAAKSRPERVRLLATPLLVVVLLLAAASSFAQTGTADPAGTGEPRFYGGSHVSFTNSNVKAGTEYDPRFGIGGGIYVGGAVWKDFDLRLEANYVQKGATLNVGRWSIEWQLDYLEVPLLLYYNLMPISRTSVQFYGGVAYNYGHQLQVEEGDNLGYDLEGVLGLNVPLESGTVVIDDEEIPRTALVISDVETTELSYMLGMGFSVPIGAVNLTFDARYTAALSDPSVTADLNQVVGEDDEAEIQSTTADVTNKTWGFYVGFLFPFGSRTVSQ